MRLLGLVMAASTLLGGAIGPVSARGGAPAAPATDADAPLDLAAMVLTPADLAAEGWDDYDLAIYDGEAVTADGLAADLVRSEDRQPAVRDALLDAGWRRGHRSRTSEYWGSDAPDLGPIVVASVSEYADAAGAGRGLALEPRGSDGVAGTVVAVEELEGVPPVGEGSRALRLVAEDPTGDPYRVVAVWFRSGSVVAGVSVTEWAMPGPSGDGVAALARRLRDRIDGVRREGAAGLSGLATRLPPAAVLFDYGFYQRLDGDEIWDGFGSPLGLGAGADAGDPVNIYLPPLSLTTGADLAGDAVDFYRSGAFLGNAGPGHAVGYSADLYRFGTPEAASRWLRETPDRLRRGAGVTGFVLQAGPEDVGDEAVSFTVGHSGDDRIVQYTTAIVVRVGATVAEVAWHQLADPPPVAAAEAAAAAQADCLRDGGPCEPVTAPREVGQDGG